MIKIIKNLIHKQQHYYFAVSMGVDSVAALLWMKNKNYNVTPIHFNHNLRIQNKFMEDKFVELCNNFNFQYHIGHGSNLVTEKDCRDARLNFYNNFKDSTILTAHHLNDYVENYLLNCFRGHPNHNPIETISKFDNYQIIHPFLLTKKKDFVEYLERNNYMMYTVADESNSYIKGSRRNWIRQQIIPEMIKNKLSLEKFAKRKISGLIKKESAKR
jgi:tRNA(Ile)-lysidine synthetase-like protein